MLQYQQTTDCSFAPQASTCASMKHPRAVMLDRDGVINFDSPDYILTPDQWQPIPGSPEAIARLTQAGIPVAIVSNQSALGRGMLDAATFDAIHAKMMQTIEQAGGRIAHVAYCPHAPDDGCTCRKPKPGLVHETLLALGLASHARDILFVGDSLRDVQAAVSVGIIPMLVQSGYGDAKTIHEKAAALYPGIATYPNLAAATDAILGAR